MSTHAQIPVFHGSWLPATADDAPSFAIWGEESELPPIKQRGRPHPSTADTPRTHPFVASTDVLKAALTSLSSPDEAKLIVWLPSHHSRPFPSNAEVGSDAPALASWQVPALLLDPIDTLRVLAGLPPELHIGDDLRFWQAAARFALALLAGQRFAPDLIADAGTHVAVWRPLLDEVDNQHAATLATLMPPACRALARHAHDSVPAPHALLDDFLDTVVDANVSDVAVITASSAHLSSDAQTWLAALAGDDPTACVSAAFAQQFGRWRDAARADQAGGFRLCLRLDPPESADAAPRSSRRVVELRTWRLRYFLQASDDPSLLLPAEQVWQARGRTLRFFERLFDQPQERMLAGLGLAARIFPPIEASLRAARPTEAALTTDEAYSFLREASLLLRGAGFGVLLPNLAASLSARLHAAPAKKQPRGGVAGLTFSSVIAFDWGLALGGEPIDPQEFLRLAALKSPLVQVRGQWVELRPEQVEQAIALLQRTKDQQHVPLAEALHTALAPENAAGMPVSAVEVEGNLAELIARLEQPAQLTPLPPPAGLHAELRPYQGVGVAWLTFLYQIGFGACLADDMGLGKTLQTIAFLLHLHASNQTSGEQPLAPALVVCPTSVVGNWRRELARFAPSLRVLVHHGADRERTGFVEAAAGHDVVVSAYPLLHRDQELLAAVEWSALVLDEAQNIKNPDTRQARAARSLRAGQRIALTGTPVENRLAELWSIFQFLNPGYLGTQAGFQRHFARPIEREHDADAAKRLRTLTGPFILRRVKTDPTVISDLPAKNEIKTYCTLTKEQATLYQAVVGETLRKLEQDEAEGMGRRSLVLTTLMRLKQVCNHPAQYLADHSALDDRSGKLARLVEMLEEVRELGERALIFTQFAQMGELLRHHLASVFGEEPLFLHGGTPAKQREPLVRRFQDDPRGPFAFILSIKAGGTGLTLTRANHVFHFDRWWNPAVENQATDRAFRIGQTRGVQVYKYICLGTVEERIDEMIERKRALAQAIVGSSEDWITELSTDQLRDLFVLRAEAVE